MRPCSSCQMQERQADAWCPRRDQKWFLARQIFFFSIDQPANLWKLNFLRFRTCPKSPHVYPLETVIVLSAGLLFEQLSRAWVVVRYPPPGTPRVFCSPFLTFVFIFIQLPRSNNRRYCSGCFYFINSNPFIDSASVLVPLWVTAMRKCGIKREVGNRQQQGNISN